MILWPTQNLAVMSPRYNCSKIRCTGPRWEIRPVLAVCIYKIFIWRRHFPGTSHFWTIVVHLLFQVWNLSSEYSLNYFWRCGVHRMLYLHMRLIGKESLLCKWMLSLEKYQYSSMVFDKNIQCFVVKHFMNLLHWTGINQCGGHVWLKYL